MAGGTGQKFTYATTVTSGTFSLAATILSIMYDLVYGLIQTKPQDFLYCLIANYISSADQYGFNCEPTQTPDLVACEEGRLTIFLEKIIANHSCSDML